MHIFNPYNSFTASLLEYTGKEPEAQKSRVTCLRPHSTKMMSWDLNLDHLAFLPCHAAFGGWRPLQGTFKPGLSLQRTIFQSITSWCGLGQFWLLRL